MDQFPFLPVTILLPLFGAALLALLVPKEDTDAVRGATLATTVVTFLVSLPLFFLFDSNGPAFQFLTDRAWLFGFGARLQLGVDGISLLLIILTTFLMPVTILCSWRGINTRTKEFHIALLILEAAMIGVFAARDLLLFFLFWEVMLIPMFLLIGVWGSDDRVRAAIKFFIYTAVGSLLMLAAIAWLYFKAGRTFDMTVIANELARLRVADGFPASTQFWLCLAFLTAFAIKVPVFPFHTWLPHAHVQAPTAGSVVLAAVLLKMGGYGFLRFCLPLFPQGLTWSAFAWMPSLATIMCFLGAAGVIYGALMALAQSDLKRLIAYSSISHLGLVVIGIFAALSGSMGHDWSVGALGEGTVKVLQGGHTRAMTGSIFQMIAHGLSTGALFFLVGCIYDRRHTKDIGQLGGLAKPAPKMATCFVIATLASVALPMTAGFVGEILILMGTFETHKFLAAAGATGMVLGVCYMLWAVQRVFFGPATGENAEVEDLDGIELAGLVPLLVFSFILGIKPGPFLDRLEPAVKALVTAYGG